uniref:Uncharacterized protein n=1 Tax=Rhodnius prolixus TaxID=13249 RepID=T1I338_RHOPR
MEVAQQIHLDHSPVMADPPLTLKECFRTRLKMDDENYRNVLNWYKSCIKLGETKSGRQKDAYTMRLIQNLLRTSSEFFGQTRLSHETVTKIENECAKMVDIILYPSDLPRKNEVTTRCPGRCPESTEKSVKTENVDDKMTPLLKHIKWAAIAASILVLFIFLILLYFCAALKSSQNMRKCDCPCDKCDDNKGNAKIDTKNDKKQCSKTDKRKRRKYNKRVDFDDDYDDDEDVST